MAKNIRITPGQGWLDFIGNTGSESANKSSIVLDPLGKLSFSVSGGLPQYITNLGLPSNKIFGTANQIVATHSGDSGAFTLSLPDIVQFPGQAQISLAPVADFDLVNKAYLDLKMSSALAKFSVRAATTSDISLIAPPDLIDGIILQVGQRILLKSQIRAFENGIYTFNGVGVPLTRSEDADTWKELVGSIVVVEEGTLNADSLWMCTSDQGGLLGASPVNWRNLGYTIGSGLTVTGTNVILGGPITQHTTITGFAAYDFSVAGRNLSFSAGGTAYLNGGAGVTLGSISNNNTFGKVLVMESGGTGRLYYRDIETIISSVQMSLTSDTNGIKLVNDLAAPGASMVYGTGPDGTKGWYPMGSGGVSTETDPVWTVDKSNYYTKSNLQTSGQAIVDWGNLVNTPAFVLTETDPIWIAEKVNYFTKTNLQTSGQAVVDWGNIYNAPAFLTSYTETDPIWTAEKVGYYTKTNLQTSGQAVVNWGNITGAPAFITTDTNFANANLTFTDNRNHLLGNFSLNLELGTLNYAYFSKDTIDLMIQSDYRQSEFWMDATNTTSEIVMYSQGARIEVGYLGTGNYAKLTADSITLTGPTSVSGSFTLATAPSTGSSANNILVRDSSTGLIKTVTQSSIIPTWSTISGLPNSGNFIFNQNAVAQTANFWISGKAKISKDSTYNDAGTSAGLFISSATYDNLGMYLGYDITTAFAFIQGVYTGSEWRPLILNPNGGNVGIGTGNVSDLNGVLTVAGVSSNNLLTLVHTANFAIGDEVGINFTQGAASNATSLGRIASYYIGTSQWGLKFYGYNGTSSAVGMTMTGAGNLLIGTTTDPGYKLNVAGTIKAGTGGHTTFVSNATDQAGIFDGELWANSIRVGYTAPQNVSLAVNGQYRIGAFNYTSELQGYTSLQQVPADGADQDKILVHGSDNVISYRTKAQLGGAGGFILNQNAAAQTSSNFWISGTGTASGYIARGTASPALSFYTTGGALWGNIIASTGSNAMRFEAYDTGYSFQFAAGGSTQLIISGGGFLQSYATHILNVVPAYASGSYDVLVRNQGNKYMQYVPSTTFALASGSGSYIQNQNSAAQTANFWISGTGKITTDGTVAGLSIDTTTNLYSEITYYTQGTRRFGIGVGGAGAETSLQNGLYFNSSLNEPVRFAFNGLVQVAVNTPSYMLDVAGTGRFNSGSADTPLTLTSNYGSGADTLTFSKDYWGGYNVNAGYQLSLITSTATRFYYATTLLATIGNGTYILDVIGNSRIKGNLNLTTQVGNTAIINRDSSDNLLSTWEADPNHGFRVYSYDPTVLAYTFTVGFSGQVFIKNIPNETVDPDKILVTSSGNVKYMTKSQLGLAPSSGSGNYIQNQNSAAQSASFWVDGQGRFDNSIRTSGGVQITGDGTIALVDGLHLRYTGQAYIDSCNYATSTWHTMNLRASDWKFYGGVSGDVTTIDNSGNITLGNYLSFNHTGYDTQIVADDGYGSTIFTTPRHLVNRVSTGKLWLFQQNSANLVTLGGSSYTMDVAGTVKFATSDRIMTFTGLGIQMANVYAAGETSKLSYAMLSTGMRIRYQDNGTGIGHDKALLSVGSYTNPTSTYTFGADSGFYNYNDYFKSVEGFWNYSQSPNVYGMGGAFVAHWSNPTTGGAPVTQIGVFGAARIDQLTTTEATNGATAIGGKFVAYNVSTNASKMTVAGYFDAQSPNGVTPTYGIYVAAGQTYLQIANETVDPDKILVSSSGIVKYMTKAQLGLSSMEVAFKVGDAGYPGQGATTYTNSAFIGKYVRVYREGERQHINTTTGITFDGLTGTITFYPLLDVPEKILIEVYGTVVSTGSTGSGSSVYVINNTAANKTLSDSDFFEVVDATTVARTITLPSAVGRAGKAFEIVKSDSSTNQVTIQTTSSQTINGSLTVTLDYQWEGIAVISDGSNWIMRP